MMVKEPFRQNLVGCVSEGTAEHAEEDGRTFPPRS